MWKHYSAYPKKIAFRDGRVWAFCANDDGQTLWWDRQDNSTPEIPDAVAKPSKEPEDRRRTFGDRVAAANRRDA